MNYEELSEERKELQSLGLIPDFYTTMGWQAYKKDYKWKDESILEAYNRIAFEASLELPSNIQKFFFESFFKYMWNGCLSPSTPIYNIGTGRGLPTSCAGQYIPDSIQGFYDGITEAAVLTQLGHGTSGYLGDIRARGTPISRGGKANGVMPVIDDFANMAAKVSQGSTRRGAWAGYLPLDHGDAEEVLRYLQHNPDALNMGFIINKDTNLKNWSELMYTRCITGKGYLWFQDKANNLKPHPLKQPNVPNIKASNLCIEIALPQDEMHSFSCILASVNLERCYLTNTNWKDVAFVARVFLDCICSRYLSELNTLIYDKGLNSLLPIYNGTKKSRAVGVGVMGWHSLLQRNMLPFASYGAMQLNARVFKEISDSCKEASKWLAGLLGEPEWCQGYGIRGVTDMAIAPTKSTALLGGSCSEGIEPWYDNHHMQVSAGAGEIKRTNPILIELLKAKDKYNEETFSQIRKDKGSVQNLDFLSENEKDVFRTAFEIDQYAILKQASQRQKFVDQAQSINLFISKDTTSEQEVSDLHSYALNDPYIKSLYYLRSRSGVKTYNSNECESCGG